MMMLLSIYLPRFRKSLVLYFFFFFNVFLARMDSGGEKEKKKTDRLADMKTERETGIYLSTSQKKQRDLKLVRGKWIATDIPNKKIN